MKLGCCGIWKVDVYVCRKTTEVQNHRLDGHFCSTYKSSLSPGDSRFVNPTSMVVHILQVAAFLRG